MLHSLSLSPLSLLSVFSLPRAFRPLFFYLHMLCFLFTPLLFILSPNSQAGDPSCTSVRRASRKHARIFACWHIVLWLSTTQFSPPSFPCHGLFCFMVFVFCISLFSFPLLLLYSEHPLVGYLHHFTLVFCTFMLY
ncbi:hypothetical protein AMTRI_Chr09g38460 [Amborella trichopoda]